MEQQERTVELILKYLSRTLTDEDENELGLWLAESRMNRAFLNRFSKEYVAEQLAGENAQEMEVQLKRLLVLSGISEAEKKEVKIWKPIAIAASIVVIVSFAAYLLMNRKDQAELPVVTKNTNDQVDNNLAPGGKKALLTLANGKNLILDSTANGLIAHEGGSAINKVDGELVYRAETTKSTKISYNTVSIPRGGSYQLTLPDGTKLWLNAETVIKFPTAFVGKERIVELKGEAFFEVSKDPKKPFKVKAGGMEVEVLGTHFNVMAYANDAMMKTTLIEGIVRVTNNSRQNILRPGQQARINKDGDLKVVQTDVEQEIAWKSNSFQFVNARIEEILQQAGRWYNAEVIYQEKIDRTYTCMMSRNEPIGHLLEMLEESGGVHFKIEGKKIIVTH